MPTSASPASRHIELLQRKSTSSTMITSELETEVTVVGKRLVADGVVELVLASPEQSPLPSWQAGAHIDLLIDEVPTRQYSLCGDPADLASYRIAILRDEHGRGSSKYVHDVLRTGDTVRVRGPRNNFDLKDASEYLFIAGGIGITPILPMVARAQRDGKPWHLVYGGRTRSSMAFLTELGTYGTEKVTVVPQDEVGLIDLEKLLGDPRPGTLIYCCGPEPLLRAVEVGCQPWPHGSLQLERFAPKTIDETTPSTQFDVECARSGITITIPPDQSILAVLESAGISVLSSCAEGTCGTCETAVLSGEPDHRDSVLDEDERAANDCMMICVSRSHSERLVLDL